MHKLKAVALGGVAVAAVLVVLLAAGVARADGGGPRTNFCNVENTWGGSFFGLLPFDQGFVLFDIFNEQPAVQGDDDGTADFALASQMADGLGNAGEGDKYHFLFTTVLVDTGATAQGHGFLFVMGSDATFVIAGHGTHPVYGSFNLSAQGDIACPDGQGTAGPATFHLRFDNMMSDDGVVGLVRCQEIETCNNR